MIFLYNCKQNEIELVARPVAAGAGVAPGFQSWPVAALYSAFKASRVVTSALTWSAGALADFKDRTLSPWAAILALKSSPLLSVTKMMCLEFYNST